MIPPDMQFVLIAEFHPINPRPAAGFRGKSSFMSAGTWKQNIAAEKSLKCTEWNDPAGYPSVILMKHAE
jgi:hypothetical protein